MNLKLTRLRPLQFLRESLGDSLSWRGNPLELVPLWLRGFTTEHILLFGLNAGNWRAYPRDVMRYRITLRTNRHVWPVLHDKLFFDRFTDGCLRRVGALFFVIDGRFHSMGGFANKADFMEAVAAGGSFVIKPARGGMGVGLLFIRSEGGKLLVNGSAKSQAELDHLLNHLEYHLCYPFVEQHSVLRTFYPDSVNTLRVAVHVGKDGRPALLAPVLRVGSSISAPIDNFCKGGMLAEIDEASGVCGRALRRSVNGKVEWISSHPESGAQVSGVALPYWQELKQDIISFHAKYPAFDLVGWDVLIGPDGYHIIEGNHNPDLRLHLLFRNVHEDAAFRMFMEEKGLM